MLLENEQPPLLPGLTHVQTQRMSYHDAETGEITTFYVFRFRDDATGASVIGMHERYRQIFQRMKGLGSGDMEGSEQ
ncbi:hypothetical protein [Henriciella sp.]|uniref:hypothetical protein n=1 Tax=Henriciella sp. TaxID=1968823 RepID=UPI000C0E8165|nr:hypothetical protein [Henriciella sp.]PHR82684.1 MAG: hypothetical protein COA64_01245 [Henriciella sp.]